MRQATRRRRVEQLPTARQRPGGSVITVGTCGIVMTDGSGSFGISPGKCGRCGVSAGGRAGGCVTGPVAGGGGGAGGVVVGVVVVVVAGAVVVVVVVVGVGVGVGLGRVGPPVASWMMP